HQRLVAGDKDAILGEIVLVGEGDFLERHRSASAESQSACSRYIAVTVHGRKGRISAAHGAITFGTLGLQRNCRSGRWREIWRTAAQK
ncbi:MAG: hypothetical protein WB756_17675, partial [Xanthobacteraceae bacterium]